MLDEERRRGGRADGGRPAVLEHDEMHREAPRRARGPGKEHFHRRGHPLDDAGRARDRERRGPPAELAVEDEEREATEVIAVEVRHDDGTDRRRIHPCSLERDERRRATVDKEAGAGPAEEQTGLEAVAAAKGIPRTEELKLDPVHGFRAAHEPAALR
jgi:hypothetical protein